MIGVLEAEKIMILESQVKHYERTVALMRQTLRDEFAMRAMQGFAANDCGWLDGVGGMAKCAYEWADAMIEARQK